MSVEKVYVVRCGRSAIGKYLGTLSGGDAVDVCAQIIRGVVEPQWMNQIDDVILGSVLVAGMGQGPARKIALTAGIPNEVPASLVSMVCGSGMKAIQVAVQEIQCGASAVLCGGFEFMSKAPYVTGGEVRSGVRMGNLALEDLMLKDGLVDSMLGIHMGVTAENIARELDITREEQDAYSYEAIRRAISAVDSGVFREEIIPVNVKVGKEMGSFSADEYPNRTSTPEKLARLKPAFLKDGTVTAGNSSGLNDGCAVLLLANEEWCRRNQCEPLFEIADVLAVGCDPATMGLGPVSAVSKILKRNHLTLDEIGSVELNEAFAAQALGCVLMISREWELSEQELLERTNLWGSGLGLGHPLGMSGARLPITLMSRMKKEKTEWGIASLCVGGGMGLATLIHKIA